MIYQSRRGVVYNLDKFISFEVRGNTASGPEGQRSEYSLVATTENNAEIILYSGTHSEAEKECNDEMLEIRRVLSKPLMVDLNHHTVNALRRQR